MRDTQAERIYEAAARWVNVALQSDGSLFVSGMPIWSLERIEDLYQRYNLRPENSLGLGYDAKLKHQLDGAPDATIQLMAEVTFVSLMVVDDISGATKRSSVKNVLSLMDQAVDIPKDLDVLLDRGIASGGLGWTVMRWAQIADLITFARQWKAMPLDEQRIALSDPWKFKSALATFPIENAYAQREALLHLLFPDVFEDIVSRTSKKTIRDVFKARLGEQSTGDADRDLLAIRTALSEEYGNGFSFYDPEITQIWNQVATDTERWDDYIHWAKEIYDWPGFDAEEYDYKIEDGRLAGASLLAAASGSTEWIDLAETAMKATNLVRWQASGRLVPWWREHPNEGREMLAAIQRSEASLADRLRGFLDPLPDDLLSGADLLRVVSFFFLGSDAKEYPPAAATALARSYKLTGYPAPPAGAGQARRYRHALAFFDRLKKEADTRGLKLRDRLDAQSVMWALTENDPPPTLSADERAAFEAWRKGERLHPPVEGPEPGPMSPPPHPVQTLQQLADELFVPVEFLDTVVSLLRERRQLIFYGPPGTGKTYIARKLMEYLAPEPERHSVVQFHPSYSYEDFVEGYRPAKSDGGGLTYTLQPGPLLRLASAASDSAEQHVLLIDEINRGNLPRILGELLYALEYRDAPVQRMYSPGDPLRLPKNLLVLGTMNTADKSIGLIDAALRRRFHFIPLFPGEGPLTDFLSLWLDSYVPEMGHVAKIVDRLNAELRKRVGRQLQVGHSYFLREDLNEEILARIWDADVLPFLEDQFFGREEDLVHFRLDRLREAVHENPEVEGMESADRSADAD